MPVAPCPHQLCQQKCPQALPDYTPLGVGAELLPPSHSEACLPFHSLNSSSFDEIFNFKVVQFLILIFYG